MTSVWIQIQIPDFSDCPFSLFKYFRNYSSYTSFLSVSCTK